MVLRRSLRSFSSNFGLAGQLLAAESWSSLRPTLPLCSGQLEAFDEGAQFTCDQNFTYSKVLEAEADEALDSLAQIIAQDEPLAQAVSLTADEFKTTIADQFIRPSNFLKSSVQIKKNGKFAGLFIALDWAGLRRAASDKEAEAWSKLEQIVLFLNSTNLIDTPKSGVVCRDVTGGVVQEFRGQGLASKCLALRLALAYHQGYSYFVSEVPFICSNANKIYAKFLEFGSEMRFADFSYRGSKVFQGRPGGYVMLFRELTR